MRAHGIQGAKRRDRPWRSTTPDPLAQRRPDLCSATSPRPRPTGSGSGLDVSRLLGGRGLVRLHHGRLQPPDRRLAVRRPHPHRSCSTRCGCDRPTRPAAVDVELIAHADRGSQNTSAAYTDALNHAGILASVGSVGNAYDDAIAESFIDTFKTEPIAGRPWRTRSQLELAIVEYVGWFNTTRASTTRSSTSRKTAS
jgi:putative transposase